MSAKPKKREVILNSASLVAVVFGVSENTVSGWRNAGLPVRDDGKYDLAAIHKWWREREEAKNRPKASDSMSDLEKRKLQIEVDRREIQLNNERGKFVDRDAAKSTVTEMFHRVRNRLLAIPEELASSLPGDQRAGFVHDCKHRVNLVLSEMFHWKLPEKDE